MNRLLGLAICLTMFYVAAASAGSISAQQSDAKSQAFNKAMAEARTLAQNEDYKEALKEYNRASKLADKKSPQCFLEMGRVYLKLNKPKDTRKNCEKGLKYASDDSMRQALFNLTGLALLREADDNKKKLRKAEEAFRQALQLGGNTAVVNYNLGCTLLRLEEDAEGIRLLQSYLELQPHGPYAATARQLIRQPRRAREPFAPDFSVVTLRGEEISLLDLSGKIVLLDFWATWCKPCRQSVPSLRRLRKKLDGEQFVLLSISIDKDRKAWEEYVANEEMDWPQVLDTDQQLMKLFQVSAFPTYLVVDSEGFILRRLQGWGSGHSSTLEREIKKGLKKLVTQ